MDPPDDGDILDIHAYLESCGTTTVRKSIGDPPFLPLAEIPPTQLKAEVERILELLADQSIEVYLDGCSPAEAYRYLTTDVMSAEIEDPRAPGWGIVFVHPEPLSEGPEGEDVSTKFN